MTDQGDGVWFRRRATGLGYNLAPVTWQGWLTTLGLTPVVLITVFTGDPRMAKPSSVPFFIKMKALLGLNGVHLPTVTVVSLIVAEVLAFILLAFWKTRKLKPVD